MEPKGLGKRIQQLVLGKPHGLNDNKIFHRLSLIAFFAWVGLGADGLSSSCYGPSGAYVALGGHTHLTIFVAMAMVITIGVIAASYSQIVEVFPHGGGGYFVASKLLSPQFGMVAGCALLIDYVLTITVSIASGTDALFSLLPWGFHAYRLTFALGIVIVLIVMNLRGIKETVVPLVPIFLIFVGTHVFAIVYSVWAHSSEIPALAVSTAGDIRSTVSASGVMGMLFLILRAYSMGAGTYTGIEAVSDGMDILREPKVHTAKKTLLYMAVSLSFVSFGLIIMYLLYSVNLVPGKTLNTVVFEKMTAGWGKDLGGIFIFGALLSEGLLLFIAAQTGFLGGPKVLSAMAVDRWMPAKFSSLSDRLVSQHGILIMGLAALLVMAFTKGSVVFLVTLYSINVFITFVLSQAGMVKHWWVKRASVKGWFRKICINGLGLALTAFILAAMIAIKYDEGGWITLFITGALIAVAILIKREYNHTARMLRSLNTLPAATLMSEPAAGVGDSAPKFDPTAKTAVVLVNGFNGLGLHILFAIIRLFGTMFRNFIFVQVGILDAKSFTGQEQVDALQEKVSKDIEDYTRFMAGQGLYAEGVCLTGVDPVDTITENAPAIAERFPGAVFFGGQIIFPDESLFKRMLHNNIAFSLQKRLYRLGIPFVIVPIKI